MHFSMLRKANIGMVFIMQQSFGGGGGEGVVGGGVHREIK